MSETHGQGLEGAHEAGLPDWLNGWPPQAVAGCAPALWPLVRAAYDSPGRHYHAWSHVLACLDHARALHFDQPRAVLLALLFHDAIYVPGRKDNEALSAELALSSLAEHSTLPEQEREQIATWIRATAQHHADSGLDHDGRLFLDVDLAVLGQPWPVYEAYAWGVRQEWCPAVVASQAYATGRYQFLQGLLAQPRIYASDEMAARLERQARENIQREVRHLSQAAQAALEASATPSPCVRRCTLDEHDRCVGCGRTLQDICDWSAMSEAQKAQCVARAGETLKRMHSGEG